MLERPFKSAAKVEVTLSQIDKLLRLYKSLATDPNLEFVFLMTRISQSLQFILIANSANLIIKDMLMDQSYKRSLENMTFRELLIQGVNNPAVCGYLEEMVFKKCQ